MAAIRDNLTARIAEAEQQGWLGEAEGLKISLAAADTKLAQTDALITRRNTTVNLGLPTFPDIAQTATITSAHHTHTPQRMPDLP
jgi:hypothetical protein